MIYRSPSSSQIVRPAKILQIGNHPPPVCGWAIQTKLLKEEIRRRGHVCDVLNINESRKIRSAEYVDVQNGADYFVKLLRFATQGYRFQVNVNGQSMPGYVLALMALIVARAVGRPATLSWRGGAQQQYFPRPDSRVLSQLYRIMFRMAGAISCDSAPVKVSIERCGVSAEKIVAIPPFSRQNLEFRRAGLDHHAEDFLAKKSPVFFSYVSFRREYDLPMLRIAMRNFRKDFPDAGFVWLGFPSKEMPQARRYLAEWSAEERDGLLLLGNLNHDEFLTLLTRCSAYIRTPMCDGVAASILEALALGVPVIASGNGTRPAGVVTYSEHSEADLREKMQFVLLNLERIKQKTALADLPDNIHLTADWLLGVKAPARESENRATEMAHAR